VTALSLRGPVLVTGGAGFIGSHVVAYFAQRGVFVRVFDLPAAPTDHLPKDGVELIAGDVRNPAEVRRAVAGCRGVIHLAGNPNLFSTYPAEFDEVNHHGTRIILAAAKEAGVERTIHVSTAAIVAPLERDAIADEESWLPFVAMVGPYLRSKWLAEEAAREAIANGAAAIIVRPSVPVGPGDRGEGPLMRLIRHFAEGRVSGYLPGTLNLIDVRELAAGFYAVYARGIVGRTYLLTGETFTYAQFFQTLAEISGRPAPRWRVPYSVALAYAYAQEFVSGRLTGTTPLVNTTGVRLTRRSFRFDSTRTCTELGLRVHPCTDALREAVAWLSRMKTGTNRMQAQRDN
jgi:dihydroflavonol-4-reductase